MYSEGMKNKYIVRRYSDNEAIGTVELTAEQFALYESIAQQPQGLITLGDQVAIKNNLYALDLEYQDLPPSTTVWLD